MALTVLTDAYDSLANIDSYWSDRNNSTWLDLSDTNKESFIRKATDWVDRNFIFIGQKKTEAQRLMWPRNYAVDTEGFTIGDTDAPWQVKEATAIVADLYSQGVYDLEGIVTSSNSIVREKVDVIEVEYDASIKRQGSDVVSHVHQLLRPLLNDSSLLRS